jgi:CHAT domain-containing protein
MVNIEPVDLENTRQALDRKTALIAYWISEQGIHSWLISRDDFRHEFVSINREKLKELIRKGRRYISSYRRTRDDADLSELYRILLGPLQSEFHSYPDLVIIPNGPLHFLPFQVLVNEDHNYLVEDYSISYAPSTSVYRHCLERSKHEGNRFLGMALGDLSLGEFSGLPGTESELTSIRKELPREPATFVAGQSTETLFKSKGGAYEYIHLATHGSYNYNQPLYSFLLFNPTDTDDGRLTVHEVFEINLNANLVTLSACETGLGHLDRGDELEGLSRAFIYAGSSSLVVSLWSVADYQTALLMSGFYSYLKDHPAGIALTLAQRDLMKQYPSPFFWAPFILTGNGRFSMD